MAGKIRPNRITHRVWTNIHYATNQFAPVLGRANEIKYAVVYCLATRGGELTFNGILRTAFTGKRSKRANGLDLTGTAGVIEPAVKSLVTDGVIEPALKERNGARMEHYWATARSLDLFFDGIRRESPSTGHNNASTAIDPRPRSVVKVGSIDELGGAITHAVSSEIKRRVRLKLKQSAKVDPDTCNIRWNLKTSTLTINKQNASESEKEFDRIGKELLDEVSTSR